MSATVSTTSSSQSRRTNAKYFFAVSEIQDDIDNRNLRKTELFLLLKPLLFFMQLHGLFFVYDSNGDGVHFDFFKKIPLPHNFWKIYSFVVIVLLALLSISYVFVLYIYIHSEFYDFVPAFTLFFSILFVAQATLIAFFLHYYCSTNSFYEMFFAYSFLAESETDKKKLNQFVFKTSCLVLTCIIAFNVLNGIGYIWIMYNGMYGMAELKFTPAETIRFYPSPIKEILLMYYSFIAFYATAPVMTSVSFFVIICLAINYILRMLCDQMRAMSNDDSNGDKLTTLDIENFRYRHHHIMSFVKAFNEIVGILIVILYGLGFLEVCCVVYFMLFYCSDGVGKLMHISWGLTGFILMALCTVVAAMVNVSVLKCFLYVQKIIRRKASSRELLMLTLFSSRTTGPEVGISAMGFFLITRQFILGLISTFISYFLVLIQFSPPRNICEKNNTLSY